MGLDMYLRRKHYVGAQYDFRNVKGNIDIMIGEKKLPINFNKVEYIEEQIGYWRKANAIHKWFVDNVQDGEDDCKEYYVDLEHLEELLGLCKEVKEKAIIKEGKVISYYTFDENANKIPHYEEGKIIENAEEIAKILPTQEGFFFGGTQYDQWYMEDIEYTIEMLSSIIEEEKKWNKDKYYSDYYYCSSW